MFKKLYEGSTAEMDQKFVSESGLRSANLTKDIEQSSLQLDSILEAVKQMKKKGPASRDMKQLERGDM